MATTALAFFSIDLGKPHIYRLIRNLQGLNSNEDGDFLVTWSLSLGDQESLLESPYLKAGFEQSVKDFINNDIRCNGDANAKKAAFLSVVFGDATIDSEGKRKAISGNGKCAGDKKACTKSMNKRKDANEELLALLNATGALLRQSQMKADFCETFATTTIFDLFREMILAASEFDFSLDVDVLNDLEGELSLEYNVEFVPKSGDSLEKVGAVDLSADEPIEINTACTDSQCFSQRNSMRSIFEYFEIPFDENKHECLYIGINCDANGLVTYIFLSDIEKSSPGRTIPGAFGSLPSLKGIFLGKWFIMNTVLFIYFMK